MWRKDVADKSCGEKQDMQFFINNFSENRAVYEIKWKKNFVEQDRPQMKTWRMRIACWISKATNTHSENVTFIAF